MVNRNAFAFARDFFQRHGFGVVAPRRDHHAVMFLVDEVGAGAAEARGQNAVRRRGRATALDVAENRDAGFKLSKFFEMFREAHGVASVADFQRGKFDLRLFFVVQGFGAFEFFFGGIHGAKIVPAHRAFGHGDDAEIGPVPAAAADGVSNFHDVVGNFGNENHVRPARDARAEREPAGAVAHDLGDDDAMVAVRRAVEAVNRFGRDVERGGEAEGGVGHGDVIVNRLGQRDDVESGLVQAQGIFLRAAAAEADKAVESPFVIIVHDDLGHVLGATVNHHAVRLVAARAKNRAADGENAGERGLVELEAFVFHEAAKAVAKADDFHPVITERRLADATDSGVESGAVAARGEDADAFRFFGHAVGYLKLPGEFVEQNFWKFSRAGKMVGATGFEPTTIASIATGYKS